MKREILLVAILLALGVFFWRGTEELDKQTASGLAVHWELENPAGNFGGAEFVRRASETVKNLPALQADLRFKVDLFDQQFSGPGRYVQKGQGSPFTRMEFQFGSGDNEVQLHQLSDGETLSILTVAMGESRLEYVNLRELKSLEKRGPSSPAGWLSIGSLPGLLAQLAEHFEFGQPVSEKLDSIPVVRLTGQWKPSALARLLEGQLQLDQTQPVPWEMLPPHLPHRVVLTLSSDDRFPMFPHQVVFQQFRQQGTKVTTRDIVVLELYRLRNADHLPNEMFYPPVTTAKADDATGFYRSRIRQFTR